MVPRRVRANLEAPHEPSHWSVTLLGGFGRPITFERSNRPALVECAVASGALCTGQVTAPVHRSKAACPSTPPPAALHDGGLRSRGSVDGGEVVECACGRLSRGKVAELLGLSFHEAEGLFRSRRVPYPAKTRADDACELAGPLQPLGEAQ